jgi:hypothetical protein
VLEVVTKNYKPADGRGKKTKAPESVIVSIDQYRIYKTNTTGVAGRSNKEDAFPDLTVVALSEESLPNEIAFSQQQKQQQHQRQHEQHKHQREQQQQQKEEQQYYKPLRNSEEEDLEGQEDLPSAARVLQGSRLASRAAGQEIERVPLRLGAGTDVFVDYV